MLRFARKDERRFSQRRNLHCKEKIINCMPSGNNKYIKQDSEGQLHTEFKKRLGEFHVIRWYCENEEKNA